MNDSKKGCGLPSTVAFTVNCQGGVDEPTDTVGVVVDAEDACTGATLGVETSYGGFGELTRREVGDLEGDVDGGGG